MMGRTSDEEGETSTEVCKTDEIDDRPLKKARYVWQIKGKYHLKKSEDKDPCYPNKSSLKDDVLSCKHSVCNSESKCDNAMEVAESSDVTFDSNTTIKNEMMSEKCSSLLHVKECEDDIKAIKPEVENQPCRPEWSVVSNVRFTNTRPASSWQLRKWQARQVARCFVDNTINRVLEDMGFVPLPVDADDILDDFPMTESENDEGLEDEAVLMAIHRHGLRTEEEMVTTSNDKISKKSKIESMPANLCNKLHHSDIACTCGISRQETSALGNLDPFHHRPVYWEQAELDSEKCLHSQFPGELKSNELVKRWFSDGLFSSVICSDSSSDSDIKSSGETMIDDQNIETAAKHANVVEGIQGNSLNKNKTEDTASNDQQEDMNSPSFEHSEFLDKAVAVAIQKKGLSKLSCADYG